MMSAPLENKTLHFVVRQLPVPLGRAFAANDGKAQLRWQTLKALQSSCLLPSDLAALRPACLEGDAQGQTATGAQPTDPVTRS